ncbi:MAG: flagellar biosynthesis protein FlhB [Pikeienuella sp.]
MAERPADGQERSHDPTPRRLESAREKGDLAQSQDAQSLAAYLGLALAVFLGGAWSAERMGAALLPMLAVPQDLARDALGPGSGAGLSELIGAALAAAALPLALPAAAVLTLLVTRRSIVVVPDKILPKLSRISPIANAGQKFGPTGLVEFGKNVGTIAAGGAGLAMVGSATLPEIAGSAAWPSRALAPILAEKFRAVMIGVLVVAAVIAGLDLIWQQHEHHRRNRMSHQELKDETKSSEGDPHLKAERQTRARALAQQKMMHDVPKADVVLTNPTHVSVALQWDRAPGSAPVCLAKGVDEIALRIRERAAASGVPIHCDPETARSIHALVEVGQEVKPEHYKAVAAAILFAERLRARARRKA